MDRNVKYGVSLPVTALLILAGIISGCATSGLPAKATRAEKQMLDQARPLPIVVAVKRYRYPAYSDKLERHLRATGLFAKVCKFDDKGVNPDLVADVAGRIHGSAVIPALTFFSLGIVPTVTEESWGNDFYLYAANTPSASVHLRYEHTSKTVLGWVAGFLNVFPSWGQRCDESSQYRDQFALAILSNPQFSALVKRKPQKFHAADTAPSP